MRCLYGAFIIIAIWVPCKCSHWRTAHTADVLRARRRSRINKAEFHAVWLLCGSLWYNITCLGSLNLSMLATIELVFLTTPDFPTDPIFLRVVECGEIEQSLQNFAMTDSKWIMSSCEFGMKCCTLRCFFPCEKCQFVTAPLYLPVCFCVSEAHPPTKHLALHLF